MMLYFLIILGTCMHVYLFKEINSNNCINGTTITTECKYNIKFNNVGNKSPHCILQFDLSNPTVKFNNYFMYVKAQEANKCPIIELNIINIVNGTFKNNKLSTTCGGAVEKIERKFSSFSSFVINLDTKGLNDQNSTVDMSLEIVGGDCKERSEESWININLKLIIIIPCSSGAFLVICVLVCYYLFCRKGGNGKHKSKNVYVEESQMKLIEEPATILNESDPTTDVVLKNRTGRWTINEFNNKKSCKFENFPSAPFYTWDCGYKMRLLASFSHDKQGKKYLSLYFQLVKGEFDDDLKWPLKHDVQFSLINQAGNRDKDTQKKKEFDTSQLGYQRLHKENLSKKGREKVDNRSGLHEFIELDKLDQYLLEDKLTIEFYINQ